MQGRQRPEDLARRRRARHRQAGAVTLAGHHRLDLPTHPARRAGVVAPGDGERVGLERQPSGGAAGSRRRGGGRRWRGRGRGRADRAGGRRADRARRRRHPGRALEDRAGHGGRHRRRGAREREPSAAHDRHKQDGQ